MASKKDEVEFRWTFVSAPAGSIFSKAGLYDAYGERYFSAGNKNIHGLKPQDADEFADMATKALQHGRLAADLLEPLTAHPSVRLIYEESEAEAPTLVELHDLPLVREKVLHVDLLEENEGALVDVPGA